MAQNMTGEVISASDDTICPLCGSESIDYVDTDFDFATMYYTCTCRECNSSFTFSYWLKNAIIDNDKFNKEVQR